MGRSGEVSVTEDKKGIKYSKAIWWEKLTPYIDTRELKNVEKEMENFVDYIKVIKLSKFAILRELKMKVDLLIVHLLCKSHCFLISSITFNFIATVR